MRRAGGAQPEPDRTPRVAHGRGWRRHTLVAAAALGAAAVIAGAFGAHALSDRLPARMLEVWATAVRYHMWHVLALLALSLADEPWRDRLTPAAVASWLAGIVLFSGSLYALALTGVRGLGVVTPFGGVALIVGWVLLLAVGLRSRAD